MSAIGQALGNRYRIEGLLGAGGMATVYRARDLRLERSVAVKVLSPNLAKDKTVARRFEQEARFLAAVSHPAIVSVYDVGEAAGEPFFVMELVDGETLTDRLARAGALPPDEAIPILTDIADGLAVLHRGGFLHRDVKPQNILLPRDGQAKLADFGLVRGERTSDLTAPGTAVGTLGYLAPELLRGETASPATDVYALAAVAYEALTGRSPYPVETVVALVDGQAEPPPLPSSVAPWLTTAFDRPLLEGLAPRDRPSVEGFAASLGDAEAGWRAAGAPRRGSAVAAAAPLGGSAVAAVKGRPPAGGGTSVALAIGAGLALGTGTADSTALTRAHITGRTARERDDARLPLVAWLLAIVGAVLGVALMVTFLGALGSPFAGTGSTPTGPSPTPTPTATPTARATTPAAGVAQAVAQFQEAVAAAQGGRDGLKGKEANELNRDAQRVADAAREGDTEEAQDRASELVDRVERLSSDLRNDDATRLRDAARRVERAAAALPEEN